MGRLLAATVGCLLVMSNLAQAQKAPPVNGKFIVLRTERVAVPSGESTHLNCSVAGLGDAAQVSCESYTAGTGPALIVYHVALVVGSNQVGYVVSCGGGLIRRIGCQPLSVGQVLDGSIRGDKLTLAMGDKTKSYTIQTSAFIGSTAEQGHDDQTAQPSPEEPNTKPVVKLASDKSSDSTQGKSSDSAAQPASTATVMVSSEPSGADLYVDGNFMGNTPSQLQLTAGSHNIRIEARNRVPWSHVISLTAGSKITIQAALDAQP